MAKSSTRRVTIYINGKEVEASVKQIRAEMNRLVNEQNRMVIGVVSLKVCYSQQNRHICKNKTKFLYNLLKIKCNSSSISNFFLTFAPN